MTGLFGPEHLIHVYVKHIFIAHGGCVGVSAPGVPESFVFGYL
jgi:hypothetical protein